MAKIFVVAKNYQQYKYYTHESPLFVYLDRPEKIIGIQKPYVIFVGEWYENNFINDIKDQLEMRGSIIIE